MMGNFHLIFAVLIVVLCTFVTISEQQSPPCPKYPSCHLAGNTDPCDGSDESSPCPGGKASCFEGVCCCIKYNPVLKHLTTGAVKPERTTGKLRIYYMRFCPFSHRIMLVSTAKNISTDVVFVNLKAKPDWFVNPLGGKVPTIETDDGSINESHIEADYLDETYPIQGELYSGNSFRKALDRSLVENYNKVMPGLLSDILYGKGFANPAEVPALMKQFEDGITRLGDELAKRGTKFFAGNDRPGMLDYMIWPWIERKPVLQMYNPNSYDYTQTSTQMAAWTEAMKSDPAVKTFGLSPIVHYEYAGSVRAGTPNYDLLAGI